MMAAKRPNILFILTDDHAAHAMSCYGSRINTTPNLDRIANRGVRLDNCFCTNSICTPSRASILAGTYNHVNGVTTLNTYMDNRLQTYPKLLQEAGYQTAIFGKWHLGMGKEHCPTGFDDWAVLPGQGVYHNPEFIFDGPDGGTKRTVRGYATDLITDMCLDWLAKRDEQKPFCLMCHHKAPHRPWEPDEKHAAMFLDQDIPEPDTLYDDYAGRAAAAAAKMRVGVDMRFEDLKCHINKEQPEDDLRKWAYQRYIKDYLRVVASVDDNVGRLLDWLEAAGLAEDTMVVYTSDQGFFLGDHGWFDKRFMYEESLRMPCVWSWPGVIPEGGVCNEMVLNVDFAPTFLEAAGLAVPGAMQGRSAVRVLCGDVPDDWQTSMYYRYWMHADPSHNVFAHYGVRTHRYKLIYYYNEPLGQAGAQELPRPKEWELFDLENDPCEMNNVYGDPTYAAVTAELKAELKRLQEQVGDTPCE